MVLNRYQQVRLRPPFVFCCNAVPMSHFSFCFSVFVPYSFTHESFGLIILFALHKTWTSILRVSVRVAQHISVLTPFFRVFIYGTALPPHFQTELPQHTSDNMRLRLTLEAFPQLCYPLFPSPVLKTAAIFVTPVGVDLHGLSAACPVCHHPS